MAAPVRAAAAARFGVRTKPPVRALARRLGVDLAELESWSGGVVTREAVEAAAGGSSGSRSVVSVPGVTRIPVTGVRKVSAAAVTASAFTAPHASLWLSVDMTGTFELLARIESDPAWSGVRVSPLAFVARALCLAIRRHHQINGRWDESAQEIVISEQVNLGFTVASPRGLLVRNIKDAQRMDLRDLAVALGELVSVARSGKTSVEEMSGGTVTITNIGSLGVDGGTPILNSGEAAILAFGAVRDTPVVVGGQVEVRKVSQLTISFDHRLVDGELGAQVLTELGRVLSDPAQAFVLL